MECFIKEKKKEKRKIKPKKKKKKKRDLNNNRLTGTIPTQLGSLTKLLQL